ncbi:CAP domain-containing protein [Oceanithermus sp.]|uniref:CAP domain-containing protein n=1 Tax=Oceanithermus sp. TaxID=2268145 RepID=UPI00257B942C|nr:CAP domain-containing protein [Oceanithermus sp.]
MRKLPAAFLLLSVLVACSAPVLLAPELRELLGRINEVRATGTTCRQGGEHFMPPVDPLREDERLNRAAQWHAEDMDAAGELSHTTPVGAVHFAVGTTPGERVLDVGYLAAAVAENIAAGYPSPQAVLQGWLESTAGHCEALMSPSYQDAGLGRSGAYWALDLAAPQ